MTQPIAAVCDRTYTAAHNSGARTKADIQFVVIHDEEASTAESAAAYFANPNSAASTQLAVDDNICYRMLSDLTIPWGAPPLNRHGIHIEQAGFQSWSKARWLLHLRTIRRCAYKTATFCKAYDIPVRWLDVSTLARVGTAPGKGKGGITSHRNVTLAFKDPASQGHTDPGPNYPYSTFLWWARYYRKRV
jgi:hypothetical protein